MTNSILTNNGAIAALMTLQRVNDRLVTTQDRISTGLMVQDASDNGSVYATAQTMRSDIGSYDVVARTLAVGEANIAMASRAAENIANEVKTIREKLTEAYYPTSEEDKIQQDIEQHLAQISTYVQAAAFKGINMLDGSSTRQDFLASVDRSGNNLRTNYITVTGTDLRVKKGGGLEALENFDVVSTLQKLSETRTPIKPDTKVQYTEFSIDWDDGGGNLPAGFSGNDFFATSIANADQTLRLQVNGQNIDLIFESADNANIGNAAGFAEVMADKINAAPAVPANAGLGVSAARVVARAEGSNLILRVESLDADQDKAKTDRSKHTIAIANREAAAAAAGAGSNLLNGNISGAVQAAVTAATAGKSYGEATVTVPDELTRYTLDFSSLAGGADDLFDYDAVDGDKSLFLNVAGERIEISGIPMGMNRQTLLEKIRDDINAHVFSSEVGLQTQAGADNKVLARVNLAGDGLTFDIRYKDEPTLKGGRGGAQIDWETTRTFNQKEVEAQHTWDISAAAFDAPSGNAVFSQGTGSANDAHRQLAFSFNDGNGNVNTITAQLPSAVGAAVPYNNRANFVTAIVAAFNTAAGAAGTIGAAGTATTVRAAADPAGNSIVFTFTKDSGAGGNQDFINDYTVTLGNANLAGAVNTNIAKTQDGASETSAKPLQAAYASAGDSRAALDAQLLSIAGNDGEYYYRAAVNNNADLTGFDATRPYQARFTINGERYGITVNPDAERAEIFTGSQRFITVRNQEDMDAATASLKGVEQITLPNPSNGNEITIVESADTQLENVAISAKDPDRLDEKLLVIETAFQHANGIATRFGSVKRRVKLQVDFVQQMSSLLTTGLGIMVDSDMPAESARLRALQTQQQLASQALAIANNAPQALLTLFRN
ncbi:MAG: flagellin [Pseudomonadota bacterium]